jgi:hypothetical protein
MNPDQLYLELKGFAEKLGVTVEEHNFRVTGVRARSGLCTVHGRQTFIMDKHKSVKKKIRLLAAALADFEHEDVYTIPAVRELLTRHAEE